MSYESRLAEAPTRALQPKERDLIVLLLSKVGLQTMAPPQDRVRDMLDGCMGGIRFARSDPRRFGRELARAEYLDSDGVLVSIALNVDDYGELFELDFWKVDFSPLKQYPSPEDVRITT